MLYGTSPALSGGGASSGKRTVTGSIVMKTSFIGRSSPTPSSQRTLFAAIFAPLRGWAAALLIALPLPLKGDGQTIILSENFESAFPAFNGWTVGDTNVNAYWGQTFTTFGTVAAHSGFWKGYCAGVGYLGTASAPLYPNSMQ